MSEIYELFLQVNLIYIIQSNTRHIFKTLNTEDCNFYGKHASRQYVEPELIKPSGRKTPSWQQDDHF